LNPAGTKQGRTEEGARTCHAKPDRQRGVQIGFLTSCRRAVLPDVCLVRAEGVERHSSPLGWSRASGGSREAQAELAARDVLAAQKNWRQGAGQIKVYIKPQTNLTAQVDGRVGPLGLNSQKIINLKQNRPAHFDGPAGLLGL
jgi:hypothetical protein